MMSPSAQPPDVSEQAAELIVVLDAEVTVPVRAGRVVAEDAPSSALLQPVADAYPELLNQIAVKPLFGPDPNRLPSVSEADADRGMNDLSQYFVVDGLRGPADDLAAELRSVDGVAGAYLKPRAEPATTMLLNDMPPRADEPPAVTPDFTSRQGYLGPAPGGVDASWAWRQPGGRGERVAVIDVEGAWRLTHEDLLPRKIKVTAGTPSDTIGWRNHGTAVAGVIGSSDNAIGTTGIAPRALLSTIAIFGTGMSSASAIKLAADALGPGDILLIELHRPGPLAGAVGQRGYIAVEWWPDDYDAILYAVRRSVLVVEPAGNGSQDLDDPAYDVPQAGFPANWSNPFRRGLRDSGAIVVGAGAPPPGTHGSSTWGPDRSRLDFSNFGSMVDVQGWGREVTSCGYGDLQGGLDSEDSWYTDQFSGTSSASPIVTGSLACAQGILRASGTAVLTPSLARLVLRETGSPQQAGPNGDLTQRIGNRPDIPRLVERARQQLTGKGSAGQKETKETKEGKEGKEGKEQEGGKSFVKLEKNEFKDMLEAGRSRPLEDATLESRVAAVEDAVAELRHFISREQRPELTGLASAEPSSEPESTGQPSADPGSTPAAAD